LRAAKVVASRFMGIEIFNRYSRLTTNIQVQAILPFFPTLKTHTCNEHCAPD
jgi:hypothetical protein